MKTAINSLSRLFVGIVILFLAVAACGSGSVAGEGHTGHHSAAHPDTGRHGVHGMLLFGGADGLFASHLPLFRYPHDRQIVLAIGFEDPELDKRMRVALAVQPRVWTLVPEPFPLDRLDPSAENPLSGFAADVVDGHFERDGRTMRQRVAVRVEAILIHRPLDPALPQRPDGGEAVYDIVGQGDAAFLVKRVTAKPDFDHVVALSPLSEPVPQGVQVGVRVQSDTANPDALAGAVAAVTGQRVAIRGTVYHDIQDLR